MTPKLDLLANECIDFVEATAEIMSEIDLHTDDSTNKIHQRYHDVIHDIMELQAEIWNVKKEIGDKPPF